MHKFWKMVQNISVVIVIIVGTIQIFQWLNKDEVTIEAICNKSDFILPEFINDSLTQFQSEIRWYSSSKFDSLFFSKVGNNSRSEKRDALRKLFKYLNNIFPSDEIQEISFYRHFYTFSITNGSEMEANTLVLEIPGVKGWYRIGMLGDITINNYFNEKISIGSIRPKNSISLYVWSTNSLDEDNTQITSANGSFEIIFSSDAIGIPKWIMDNHYFFEGFFPWLILILLILLIYSLIMAIKAEPASDNAQDDK